MDSQKNSAIDPQKTMAGQNIQFQPWIEAAKANQLLTVSRISSKAGQIHVDPVYGIQ